VFEFNLHTKKFASAAVQNITLCNSFYYTDLAKEKTAVFIRFSDAKKENYDMVEFFIRDIYSALIEYADNNRGSLDFPVYIMLDEFGNLPASQNFGNVISACRSRNIWFTLVIQSYSQLFGKYGNELAGTIKDNCNLKCFFGTNDYMTLEAFSRECLRTTQIAFSSIFKSKSDTLDTVDIEDVPVVTITELNAVREGEFYIKMFRKNAMKSMTVRSYLCPEFNYGNSDPDEYMCGMDIANDRYGYNLNYLDFKSKVKKHEFSF
jgi:type IV secretion system protein VirD4